MAKKKHEDIEVPLFDNNLFSLPREQAAEKKASYMKKMRKEKKERKAKRKAEIQDQENARREAGLIAIKMVKVARQAVKEFKKMPSSQSKGFIDFSDEKNTDLIAIETHGRTGFAHLINGSLAEGIAKHEPKPVLSIKIPSSSKSASKPMAHRTDYENFGDG